MHPQSHSSYEAGRLQLHGQPDVVHDRPSDSLVPTDGVIAATPHEVEGTGAKREGSMARERKKDREKMKKKTGSKGIAALEERVWFAQPPGRRRGTRRSRQPGVSDPRRDLGRRPIGGAVIHRHDFEARVVLRKHAVETLVNTPLLVARGDDDRDARPILRPSGWASCPRSARRFAA